MNQPYACVNQRYATLTLASALREMFGVQLYKNNARALLSRILSILNLDWLQHARSGRGVYEDMIKLNHGLSVWQRTKDISQIISFLWKGDNRRSWDQTIYKTRPNQSDGQQPRETHNL